MNKKILIVDDEMDFAEMLQKRLESQGFQVVVAYNGQEGLEKVKEFAPDLVILDIVMPVMDGSEMASRLKGDSSTASIPILFLTCLAEGLEDVSSLQGEADLVLAKPFEPERLLKAIDKILS